MGGEVNGPAAGADDPHRHMLVRYNAGPMASMAMRALHTALWVAGRSEPASRLAARGSLAWMDAAMAAAMPAYAQRAVVVPWLLAHLHPHLLLASVVDGMGGRCARAGCALHVPCSDEAPPLPAGVKLSRCGGCGLAYYCGKECQHADWGGAAGHKHACGPLRLAALLATHHPKLPAAMPAWYAELRPACRTAIERPFNETVRQARAATKAAYSAGRWSPAESAFTAATAAYNAVAPRLQADVAAAARRPCQCDQCRR
jgi:hypothetical protein